MFIIFGAKDFEHFYGESYERCPACGYSTAAYIKKVSWFTLFFLPIFPVSTKYLKVCRTCGFAIKMNRDQFFAGVANRDQAPPPSFQDSAEFFGTARYVRRQIVIKRKKQKFGREIKIDCFIDENKVASLANGETVGVPLDNKEFSFSAQTNGFDNEIKSQTVEFKPDMPDSVCILKFKGRRLVIERFVNSNTY